MIFTFQMSFVLSFASDAFKGIVRCNLLTLVSLQTLDTVSSVEHKMIQTHFIYICSCVSAKETHTGLKWHDIKYNIICNNATNYSFKHTAVL